MERLTEATHILPPESSGLASPLSVREYHVTFDGRHWNVGTDDGDTGPSSFDRDMALTLAIRAAPVCVEDQDGTFSLAWASA